MEFGTHASVADWLDLEALGANKVNGIMNDLAIPTTFNEKKYFVTRAQKQYYYFHQRPTTRVYFFERHGGKPPSNWMVHAELGDITLGSWYDVKGQVLCHQDSQEGPAPTPSAANWFVVWHVRDHAVGEIFSTEEAARAKFNELRGGSWA